MEVMCLACIGGTLVKDNLRQLESGVHVVVGTPGRVKDMVSRGSLGTARFAFPFYTDDDDILNAFVYIYIYMHTPTHIYVYIFIDS